MAGIDVVRMTQTAKSANVTKTTGKTTTSKADDSKTVFSDLIKQNNQKVSADTKQSTTETDADGKSEKAEGTETSKGQKKSSELLTELQTAVLMGLQNVQNQEVLGEQNSNGIETELNEDITAILTEALEKDSTIQEQAAELLQSMEQLGSEVPDENVNVKSQAIQKHIDQAVKTKESQAQADNSISDAVTDEILRPVDAQAVLQSKSEFESDAEKQELSQLSKSANKQDDTVFEADDNNEGIITLTAEHQLMNQHQELSEVPQEGTTVVRTQPETFAQDIGTSLASKLPSTNGELTIELEPVSLGKLTIKVLYEGDKAAVSIMASNPKTLELLSQSAGEIARILKNYTGQETTIYTPEPQQQSDWTQGGQKNQQERQQEEQKKHRNHSESFAQQLRLGLV